MPAPEWTCADCGTPGAYPVNDPKMGSFLSIDTRARYTTGYCDRCSRPHGQRKTARKVSRLIRTEAFDPERFAVEREKTKLKELVQLFASGKDRVQLTDQQVLDLVRLVEKHGAPGFYLPEWVREREAALKRR